MPKLKLGPIQDDKPVRVVVDLPAQIHRDLVAYGEALGAEAGHAAVAPDKLIGPMLARFIVNDRAFLRTRRLPERRKTAAGAE